MSDDEYYSDSNSENEDEVEEIITKSKPALFKPSENIKMFNEYDADEDLNIPGENDDDDVFEEDEDEDEDIQDGGVASEEDEEDDIDEDEGESDIEVNENGDVAINQTTNKSAKNKKQLVFEEEDEEDEEEYDENYLQKFDNDILQSYINEFHPECLSHNYDEISKLSVVTRNPDGIIVDPLHRTIPYLTKYERAKILGQRANQLETGAKPLVKVPENVIDSYIIAELELREKRIPFIIRRPIPSGAFEYWNLKDLEIIAF
jgi:DNA-directed RNA polymerase I, II, and III subunit RPABC2